MGHPAVNQLSFFSLDLALLSLIIINSVLFEEAYGIDALLVGFYLVKYHPLMTGSITFTNQLREMKSLDPLGPVLLVFESFNHLS